KDLGLVNRLLAATEHTKEEMVAFLAAQLEMEVADLNDLRPSSETLAAVPRKVAQEYAVFPIDLDGSEITLAMADPYDIDASDNLNHLLGRSIHPKVAAREDVIRAINEHYGVSAEAQMAGFLEEYDEEGVELVDIEGAQEASEEDAPIIRYVHSVIQSALDRRASDIHLEPLEKKFRIRYRIDGKLMEVDPPPKRLQPSILSRIKIMANISIAEKRLPQDGRINVKAAGRQIDLRVSTLPTAHGESIVMRILDKESLRLGLPELGFFSDDQAVFERIIAYPDGIFLVTGPTGSGKSTTLYSALNFINTPDRKIITVEDPVEYELVGINQVQVRRDVGMTFSAALRAMLRQAPNIIMVGEIRDLETAEIAINASLTGHLVFSTLHTNDAPSAVSRLIDMGVKPFLVSASLRAVLAQRLIRTICPHCTTAYEPTKAELLILGMTELPPDSTFMKGIGCEACNGIGFRGRKGIFELFTVTEEMAEMIYRNATLVELRAQARDMGMRNMREDGMRKVIAGMTTLDEVMRVTVEQL
ncbi:MAG: GspE/PulE family protein, partial [Opitutales bacterium]